uniref:Uncharacterized protein n=1 Tax=Phaeomonas parva TaxID=124430 RepID=A0A7S1XMH1_9STRA
MLLEDAGLRLQLLGGLLKCLDLVSALERLAHVVLHRELHVVHLSGGWGVRLGLGFGLWFGYGLGWFGLVWVGLAWFGLGANPNAEGLFSYLDVERRELVKLLQVVVLGAELGEGG